MAELADFDRFVLVHVKNPPLPAVRDAVLDAAREFCTRTRIETEFVELSIVAGDPVIDVDASDSAYEACDVLSVITPEGKLRPRTKLELEQRYPKGWMNETTADPRLLFGYFQPREYELRIVPTLTIDATVTAEIALRPRLPELAGPSTKVPDVLLDSFADEIGYGAAARLHAHVNAFYADRTQVAGFRATFNAAVIRAADRHEAGHNKPDLYTGRDVF
jgi:hypothetical protein